jgi:hypothetical protein
VGSSGGAIIRFGSLPGVSYWFSHAPETVGNRPRDDNIRRIIAALATRAGVVAALDVNVTLTMALTPPCLLHS